MENGNIRIAVFLLLGIALLMGLSALVSPGGPRGAVASERSARTESQVADARTAVDPSLGPPERTFHPPQSRERDDGSRGSLSSREFGSRADTRADSDRRRPAFLSRSHDLVLPPSRPESYTWRWEDDSPQIAFDGCKPVTRDRSIPPMRFAVEARVDLARLQALEEHFGFYPPEVMSVSSSGEQDAPTNFEEQVGPEMVEALRLHGVDVVKSTVQANISWIVRNAAPELRSLAAAVVDAWRQDARTAETRNGAARGGNMPRTRDDIEALTSFVQRGIPYADIPPSPDEHERCGVRTPGPTLTMGGDCDSKAALLATLIRSHDARVPIVMISLSVRGRPHMMLGVGIPAGDCTAILDYRGQRYVLIEVTSALGVGIMAPDYNDARLERYEVIP